MEINANESNIYSYVIEEYNSDNESTSYGELRLKIPYELKYEKVNLTEKQQQSIKSSNIKIKDVVRKGKRKIEVYKKGYGTIKRINYTKEKYEELKGIKKQIPEYEQYSDVEIIRKLKEILKNKDKKGYGFWQDFEAHFENSRRSVNKGTETDSEKLFSIYIDYAGAWQYDKEFNLYNEKNI